MNAWRTAGDQLAFTGTAKALGVRRELAGPEMPTARGSNADQIPQADLSAVILVPRSRFESP